MGTSPEIQLSLFPLPGRNLVPTDSVQYIYCLMATSEIQNPFVFLSLILIIYFYSGSYMSNIQEILVKIGDIFS